MIQRLCRLLAFRTRDPSRDDIRCSSLSGLYCTHSGITQTTTFKISCITHGAMPQYVRRFFILLARSRPCDATTTSTVPPVLRRHRVKVTSLPNGHLCFSYARVYLVETSDGQSSSLKLSILPSKQSHGPKRGLQTVMTTGDFAVRLSLSIAL